MAKVKGYDPLNFLNGKEVHKTRRIIHFAVLAAEEAVQYDGFIITNGWQIGWCSHRFGYRRTEIIEREHSNFRTSHSCSASCSANS